MRKLIAWAFMYSLDGLLADEGTEYWQFCFGLPVDPAGTHWRSAFTGARTRTSWAAPPTTAWPEPCPTIAAGDTKEEIDKLRQGGDGHIVVWGGVSLWRSLMRLDLIDEFRLDLHPYVAGEGTRLFEDVPKNYRLELVSSTEFSNDTVGLQYRRHR
jgi:dihydrofolate reductase